MRASHEVDGGYAFIDTEIEQARDYIVIDHEESEKTNLST